MDNLSESTINALLELTGLTCYNIEFKVHDKPFNDVDHGMCRGLFTELDNGFIIDYTTANDELDTVLHELVHVQQYLNDRELDCIEAEKLAEMYLAEFLGEIWYMR